ncbi:MAG: hypothetical protein RL748_2748 [Pseudomonadota bacterium]|jgi:uncharacterized protein (DUF1778 family)
MIMPTLPISKRESLNIRIKPEERRLIDRAAQLRGKNCTDFILDAARQAAEETLADQRLLYLTEAAWAQFLARLDAPPAPNENLKKTMQTPAPWDAA